MRMRELLSFRGKCGRPCSGRLHHAMPVHVRQVSMRQVIMQQVSMLRVIIGLFFAGMLFCLSGAEAHALELKEESERTDSYQLLYINTDTFLYEEADEASAVLRELQRQELVVPVEVGAVWAKVTIGNAAGYVKSEYVQAESPDPLVAREMEEQAQYNAELINEVERLTKEQKRSRIYGIIVICIIAGIFGAGIVSTVLRRKQIKKS